MRSGMISIIHGHIIISLAQSRYEAAYSLDDLMVQFHRDDLYDVGLETNILYGSFGSGNGDATPALLHPLRSTLRIMILSTVA